MSDSSKKAPKLSDLSSPSISSDVDRLDTHSTVKAMRHVERGILKTLPTFSVLLRFENFPAWILALDPQFLHNIYLPAFSCWISFQRAFTHTFHNPVLLEALLLLTPNKFIFGSLPSPSDPTLYLFSGSVVYLNSIFESTSSHPTLYLVDEHLNPRQLPSLSFPLSRISHFLPTVTSLRRRVGSIIDHSVRSGQATVLPVLTPHLTLDNFLPLHHLDAQVLITSHFSASGFCLRKLQHHELLIAFGIPSHYHHLHPPLSAFVSIIPLQLMDALLRPAALITLSSHLSRHKVPQFTLASPSISSNGTFLPTINRILPHTWCEEKEHVQQAAKEDDTPIDYSLWNLQISTVFPHVTPKWCDWLRDRLLARQKVQLYSEFVSYLRSRHAALYSVFLTKGRAWIVHQQASNSHQGGSNSRALVRHRGWYQRSPFISSIYIF